MPTPGYDTYIVDEPTSGASATATDTLYLLSTAGIATPVAKTKADTGDATLDAYLRAFFAVAGRGSSVVVQGIGDGTTLPTPANALALLPPGPGQVVAPESVTSATLIPLLAAWSQNKVLLANGASGLSDAQLATLSAALIAGGDGRGAALFADYYQFPQVDGTGTDNIPAALIVAALCARNDLRFKNPNVAAAGVNGIVTQALSLTREHTPAEIATLKGGQINAAKKVSGQFRNYGFRTLADLTTKPLWWDLSGSRTVMAYRAMAAAIDEDFVFGQVDGVGTLQGRYQSRLETAAKQLYDAGALYGASPDEAYRVDTSPTVNPVAAIAAGEVTGQVYLKTSPFAEHLVTNITRRAITATV